jgi:hypothetical protein
MRNLRLISTAAAILLLGVGAVSAQTMKTDETPAPAPAAQQNAPAEKVAPALKSGQLKAPESTGQTTQTAPEADKKQLKSQTMDNAPAGAAIKGSSDANGSATGKNKNSAAEGAAGAASPSGKSADENKRSTTGQGAVDEGVVSGPKPVRHRHYRHHYRNCLPNIFDHGNCWR